MISITNIQCMQEIKFETLTKKKAKLYINLFGKSGCGKTYTALTIASNLTSNNNKVLIIDTEDRAHYYANDFAGVNVFNAKNIKVSDLLLVIQKAHKELKIEAVVIDSLTPFWDAMIEYADNQKSTAHGANWKVPKKTISTMTLALRRCGLHVITTSLGKDETDNNMKPTGKVLPCFERPKFEPYLDIQIILDKNGTILETPKKLHHDLNVIFQKNTQINEKWCKQIKEWLAEGKDIATYSNGIGDFIKQAQNAENENSVESVITITENEVKELQILIDKTNQSAMDICELYNINALQELPKSDFEILKKSLQNDTQKTQTALTI